MAQVVYKEEGTLEQAALSTLPSKVRIVLVSSSMVSSVCEEHLVVFEESQEADSLFVPGRSLQEQHQRARSHN